jgi:hypothetical protein
MKQYDCRLTFIFPQGRSATGYGLNNKGSFTGRGNREQTGPKFLPASYLMITGGSLLVGKAAGHETGHSLKTSADAKKGLAVQ